MHGEAIHADVALFVISIRKEEDMFTCLRSVTPTSEFVPVYVNCGLLLVSLVLVDCPHYGKACHSSYWHAV
jgi:hypothetical protein